VSTWPAPRRWLRYGGIRRVLFCTSSAHDAVPDQSVIDRQCCQPGCRQHPQNPGVLAHAAADLYAVIYPANHALWPSPPLCNPCNHHGNAIFHDHVLDSIQSDPGHGEFNALWHVFVIRPASAATQAAYALRLPMKTEAEIDAAIDAGVASKTDTGSYFLCSIVNAHAGGVHAA
jgi:hypothetical protein